MGSEQTARPRAKRRQGIVQARLLSREREIAPSADVVLLTAWSKTLACARRSLPRELGDLTTGLDRDAVAGLHREGEEP